VSLNVQSDDGEDDAEDSEATGEASDYCESLSRLNILAPE
jgi:hypothetical protein